MVLTKNYRRSRISATFTGSIAYRKALMDNSESSKTEEAQFTSEDRDTANELDRLQREWYDNVPEDLQYDVDDTQNHRYWPAYLNIYFL